MGAVRIRADPQRLARDEASHVLAADERDMLAEARPVKLDEAMPVAVFLAAHGLQGLGRCGKVAANALAKSP